MRLELHPELRRQGSPCRIYYSGRNADSHFGAVYTFTTDDHTCEGEIKLTAVSDEMFPDNGHAIAWALAH